MKHKSIFFSISLIFSSFCLSAQELPKEVVWQEVEGVNVPIPPQTHPRLYVRSSDLPALKERLKTPQAQQTLSLMKELSKDRTPAEEAAVTNRGCSCKPLTICWKVTNVWHAVPLQPCSIRCSVPLSALVPTCRGPTEPC